MIDEGFAQLPGMDPTAMALKRELSEIILWTERNSPRSKQLAVGPSELGDACDRRLAYRIAGNPPSNTGMDPWPAVVGSSIHSWLERAITEYQRVVGDLGYLTETHVYPDPLVAGHSDLFNVRAGRVIDWKAQPLDEQILTPTGWVQMGDLKIGDLVIGSEGTAIKVEGIFPLGEKQVYKVWTSDHAWAEATGDHLWQVHSRSSERWVKVLTTEQIATELAKSRPSYQILPMLPPVVFDSATELPLDPYPLGLLLGDGGFSTESIKFTSSDGLEKFLPFKVSAIADKSSKKSPTFTVLGAMPTMRGLGLTGHLSVDKFIPKQYLRASVADRLALLQGLMDTDGCLQKKRACFTTSSNRLATDFIELVQSLGGKCFDHVDKKLRKGATRLAHLITFKLPPGMCPFRADLSNKKLSWVRGVDTHERFIKKIEPSRITEVQCIKVSAADGLYVTRGYLLTHNTIGIDGMRKVKKGNIPPGYRVQIQIYGLGHERAGRVVKEVALVFLSRSGWLNDAFVWVEPYDREVAIKALNRMYEIADKLIAMEIEKYPHRYQLIDASPGDSCVWCPFLNREMHVEVAASEKGCPGR